MQTASLPRITIFKGRLESYMLLIPALLMALAVIEIFITGVFFKIPSLHRHLINNVLFFNFTHVVLTYFMIFTMPQMQAWSAVLESGKPRFFWTKTAGLFALIYAGVVLMFLNISPFAAAVISVLQMVMPTQHVLWQMRGLSLCYNQQIRQISPEEICNLKVKRSEFLERAGFYIFLIAILAVRLLKSDSQWVVFIPLAWCGVIVGAVLIFAGALNFPMVWQSNKIAYLTRIMFYPLGGFSLFASSAVGICHGLEYFCVFDKISHNSFSEKKKRTFVLLTGCLLLVLFGGLYSFMAFSTSDLEVGNPALPLWMTLVQAMLATLVFLHYYLDRVLFRMRDPHTRSHIAPLLRA